MTNNSEYGKPLFPNIKYCSRCCIPETQEGQKFDEMGICQACQSSEQKIHINWVEREKQLRQILETAKEKAKDNYDCILPLSGGKDSTFQAHVLVNVYGMKPLGVTANHNWYSETGWYNLQNLLEEFEIDHIMFTPNRRLVNNLAKRSIELLGDTCWLCHSGAGSFPLHIASKFKIPLLVYGESIADTSGRASYFEPLHKFDRNYSLKISSKFTPEEMTCEYISKKDTYPYITPSVEELEVAGVTAIHLGDFLFWDDERQTEFVRDYYNWKETEIEGTYKGYKSAECIMAGMHDFTCYLKRGYGRATFQASIDVRNGLLTREEGFELAKKYDCERPEALDYYLKITNMSEKDFYQIMKNRRKEQLKEAEIPVIPRKAPNRETIKPFAEQILEKHRNRRDPRDDNLGGRCD